MPSVAPSLAARPVPEGGRSLRALAWILLAGALCYANTFRVPFLFDDPVPSEPLVYKTRQLVWASFALNRLWSGAATWSYHLVNLGVHLACAGLLLGVLRRAVARAAPALAAATREGLCLASVLAWTCHPLQTESVTYLSQRAESLGSLFILACLYAFLRSVESERARPWQVLSLLALVLGFATKEIIATAPVLVLLFDAVFLAGGLGAALRARKGYYAALFGTAAVSFASFTALLFFEKESTVGFHLREFGALEYARTQPGVILHYLRLVVWPYPLVFDYKWPIAQSLGAWLPQTLVVAALVAGGLVLLWRRSWIGFALAWFFVLLAPTSSVLPIRDPAFEHRTYLALAAVVALVVAGAWSACKRFLPALRHAPTALASAVVLALGATTVRRNQDYQSLLALWGTVVERAPHNERGYANLATGLLENGRVDEAIAALETAIRLDPEYHQAYNRLGNAHVRRADFAKAIPCYERAAAIEPDPVYRHGLGNALFGAGDFARAEREYRVALERSPDKAEYHESLANALVRLERKAEAAAEYRAALALDPGLENSHVNLAVLLVALGAPSEALEHYQRALAIAPNTAQESFNLGQCLVALGRLGEAEAAFRESSRLAPELAEPYAALAKTLCAKPGLKKAEKVEAVHLAQQANTMTGAKRADVLETLALAYATNGEPERAIPCLEQALALPGPTRNAEFRARLQARLAELHAELHADGAPTPAGTPPR